MIVAIVIGISLTTGNITTTVSSGQPSTTTTGTVVPTGSGQPTGGVTLSTAPPPWPIPADAAPYIAAVGLQAQSGETLEVHYHAHVDIIDNGSPQTVPAHIGFVITNGQGTGISSLHTHDTSGIVHVESATDTPYTLGQVFTEWGVRLTSGQIGGLVTANGNVVRVFVDGTPFTGDPATIVLRSHQEIAFWYGSTTATPQVPSSYSFPAGD